MGQPSLRVVREADAAELPAGVGGEEVAVTGADVRRGRGAGATAQDQLATHELAVVLAERAGGGAKARVGRVGAGGPLPHVAIHLLQARAAGRGRGRVEALALDEIAGDRQPR